MNIDFVSTPFTPDTTNFTCVRSIQVIPAHGSCTITISFRPSTTGLRSGTIEASGPSFHTTAAVSGTGVAARGSARHATADPSASAEPERGWTVTLRHGVPVLRRD